MKKRKLRVGRILFALILFFGVAFFLAISAKKLVNLCKKEILNVEEGYVAGISANIKLYDSEFNEKEDITRGTKIKYQNKKIGTKLIEQMINDCRKNNVSSITLEVKKSNNNAIHLYEKMGFTKVSIRKGYYQGIDGILMEKELN